MPLKVVPRRDRKLFRLVKRAETRKLERGEVLFRKGVASHDLFLVKTGYLRFTRPEPVGSPGGLEEPGRIVDIAGPWEVAGEEALLPDTPRRMTTLAGRPTQVAVLPGPECQKALQTSQRTLEAFLRAKEEELALARALSVLRRSGGAGARLGAVLLHLSARHGRPEEGGGVRIGLPLTHQLLADLSAAHRSTVTTLLNDWIYQGVLGGDRGAILILRPAALAGN